MNSINNIQDSIIEEFSLFGDWTERYKYIIDLGKELDPLEEKYKNDDYKIRGCQSNVWVNAYVEGGKIYFEADSDALIVKGLIALLVRVLSGHKPEDIAHADLYFIREIGMQQHLSPTRSNGLLAMIKQMKIYALAFQHKMQKEEKNG